MKKSLVNPLPVPLIRKPVAHPQHINPRLLPVLTAKPGNNPQSRAPRRKVAIPMSARVSNEFKSLPNAPLTAREILDRYNNLLTDRERFEIVRVPQIYYIRGGNPSNQSRVDHEFFQFIENDHINYRFQQLVQLGAGAFGVVIKCFDHRNQKLCAVKLVKENPKIKQQLDLEREILRMLNNKDSDSSHHVIHMYDSFTYRSYSVFVFELLGGDLYSYLKNNRFQGLDGSRLKLISRQIADAVAFTHSNNIVHCDIKPENILWTGTRNCNVKLIDFGCSCYQNNTLFTYIQSRFYRAPEVILGIPYGTEIDIWSFGCVLAELSSGEPLFAGNDEGEQMTLFMSILGVPPADLIVDSPRKKYYFDDRNQPILKPNSHGVVYQPGTRDLAKVIHTNDYLLVSLLQHCFKWRKRDRITAKDVLSHPWFTQRQYGSS